MTDLEGTSATCRKDIGGQVERNQTDSSAKKGSSKKKLFGSKDRLKKVRSPSPSGSANHALVKISSIKVTGPAKAIASAAGLPRSPPRHCKSKSLSSGYAENHNDIQNISVTSNRSQSPPSLSSTKTTKFGGVRQQNRSLLRLVKFK